MDFEPDNMGVITLENLLAQTKPKKQKNNLSSTFCSSFTDSKLPLQSIFLQSNINARLANCTDPSKKVVYKSEHKDNKTKYFDVVMPIYIDRRNINTKCNLFRRSENICDKLDWDAKRLMTGQLRTHHNYLRKGELSTHLREKEQSSKEFRNLHTANFERMEQRIQMKQQVKPKSPKFRKKECEPYCGLFKIKCCRCNNKGKLDNFNEMFEEVLKKRGVWYTPCMNLQRKAEENLKRYISKALVGALMEAKIDICEAKTIANDIAMKMRSELKQKLEKSEGQMMRYIENYIDSLSLTRKSKLSLMDWSMKIGEIFKKQLIRNYMKRFSFTKGREKSQNNFSFTLQTNEKQLREEISHYETKVFAERYRDVKGRSYDHSYKTKINYQDKLNFKKTETKQLKKKTIKQIQTNKKLGDENKNIESDSSSISNEEKDEDTFKNQPVDKMKTSINKGSKDDRKTINTIRRLSVTKNQNGSEGVVSNQTSSYDNQNNQVYPSLSRQVPGQTGSANESNKIINKSGSQSRFQSKRNKGVKRNSIQKLEREQTNIKKNIKNNKLAQFSTKEVPSEGAQESNCISTWEKQSDFMHRAAKLEQINTNDNQSSMEEIQSIEEQKTKENIEQNVQTQGSKSSQGSYFKELKIEARNSKRRNGIIIGPIKDNDEDKKELEKFKNQIRINSEIKNSIEEVLEEEDCQSVAMNKEEAMLNTLRKMNFIRKMFQSTDTNEFCKYYLQKYVEIHKKNRNMRVKPLVTDSCLNEKSEPRKECVPTKDESSDTYRMMGIRQFMRTNSDLLNKSDKIKLFDLRKLSIDNLELFEKYDDEYPKLKRQFSREFVLQKVFVARQKKPDMLIGNKQVSLHYDSMPSPHPNCMFQKEL